MIRHSKHQTWNQHVAINQFFLRDGYQCVIYLDGWNFEDNINAVRSQPNFEYYIDFIVFLVKIDEILYGQICRWHTWLLPVTNLDPLQASQWRHGGATKHRRSSSHSYVGDEAAGNAMSGINGEEDAVLGTHRHPVCFSATKSPWNLLHCTTIT